MKTNTLDFDAQAMRERILDLAMRGKLVPQDPNDEPASVLLEKIKAEKEELVKEKKIKKTKALPAITDDEKPFDIPDSWEWVRLGDIALSINDGVHFKPKYVKSGIKFATAKNISSGKLDLSQTDYISREDYDEFSKKVNPELGDLLLSKDGTIGAAAINDSKEKLGLLSSIAVVKTDKNQVSNYYLSYVIKSPFIQRQIKENIRGITYRHWNLKRINTTYIPFPPLSEQKRIAAKIAQLFALLRKVESSTQQYAELQTLLKSKVLDLAMRGKLVKQDPNDEPASVLLEKIKAEKAELVKEKKIKKSKPLPPITDEEKPFDIPDSWEWVRLGNIVSYQNGYAYKSSELVKIRKGLPVIKSQNIMTLKVIIKDNNDYVKEPNEKMLNSKIIKGDLLMCLSSQSKNPEPLGKTAIYDLDKPALLNQRVLKLKLINHSMTDLIYYFINSSWFHFTVSHRGSGSGQSNLKLGDVMNMPIPVPPLNEEKHIVNRIEILFKKLSN